METCTVKGYQRAKTELAQLASDASGICRQTKILS